jgi:hypothetical protein
VAWCRCGGGGRVKCGVGRVWGWRVVLCAWMGLMRCGTGSDLKLTWAEGSIGGGVVSHVTYVMTFVTHELPVEIEQSRGWI